MLSFAPNDSHYAFLFLICISRYFSIHDNRQEGVGSIGRSQKCAVNFTCFNLNCCFIEEQDKIILIFDLFSMR
jgi:hypothetical protein